MKLSSIISACALALLAPKSALVAASSCSGDTISVSNAKVLVDSDGAVSFTGEATFSGLTESTVDVDISVMFYKVMEQISIDLCEGATSTDDSGSACPADGTYDLSLKLGDIPEEYVSFVSVIPYVTATIYQEGTELSSCSISDISVATSAMIWNGVMSVGAVAIVVGGLFISKRRRVVATEDDNGSASFVEMGDNPDCQGVVVA